jgi:putative membrane protein
MVMSWKRAVAMMGCIGYVGWMWAWPVLVVVGLAALTLLAVLLARGAGSGTEHNGSERADADVAARRILDERHACGDIDEQYHRQRRDAMR